MHTIRDPRLTRHLNARVFSVAAMVSLLMSPLAHAAPADALATVVASGPAAVAPAAPAPAAPTGNTANAVNAKPIPGQSLGPSAGPSAGPSPGPSPVEKKPVQAVITPAKPAPLSPTQIKLNALHKATLDRAQAEVTSAADAKLETQAKALVAAKSKALAALGAGNAQKPAGIQLKADLAAAKADEAKKAAAAAKSKAQFQAASKAEKTQLAAINAINRARAQSMAESLSRAELDLINAKAAESAAKKLAQQAVKAKSSADATLESAQASKAAAAKKQSLLAQAKQVEAKAAALKAKADQKALTADLLLQKAKSEQASNAKMANSYHIPMPDASEEDANMDSLYAAAVWGDKPEYQVWTDIVVAGVRANLEKLELAHDKSEFCPGYKSASAHSREVCWLRLIGALSEYESGFNTNDGFREPDGQMSLGLMALSPNECKAYQTETLLKDGVLNLSCGVAIFVHLVARDGYVNGPANSRGAASYWSVLRDPYTFKNYRLGKKDQILKITKSYREF